MTTPAPLAVALSTEGNFALWSAFVMFTLGLALTLVRLAGVYRDALLLTHAARPGPEQERSDAAGLAAQMHSLRTSVPMVLALTAVGAAAGWGLGLAWTHLGAV